MKMKKIIKYLKDALDNDDSSTKVALKSLVLKMKKKEHKLKSKLEVATDNKEREELKAKLEVNRAHREKGVQALQKLKQKK